MQTSTNTQDEPISLPSHGGKRTPLTKAEKKKHLNRGGMFTADEKKRFIDLVRNGVLPMQAVRRMHRSWNTLSNSLAQDEKFAAEFEQGKVTGVGGRVESALVDLALGRCKRVKQTFVRLYVKDVPQCNPDGSPTMVLRQREETLLEPDKVSLQIWLRAYAPERFAQASKIDLSSPNPWATKDEALEDLQRLVLERHNPRTTSDN